jgi:hypothetical protein
MVWIVPKGGLEPPCPCEHNALNVACLPISPLRHSGFVLGDVDYNTASLVGCQEDGRPFCQAQLFLAKELYRCWLTSIKSADVL